MNRVYTIKDIRAAGMCAKRARLFFKQNNLDWSDFIKNGITLDKIPNVDNALIQQVIKAVDNGK